MQTNSRYIGAIAYLDVNGNLFLGDRVRFPYIHLSDNSVHTVRSDQTLRSIASMSYASLSIPPKFYAASLYFVIADFQPEDFEELQDPSLPLIPGTALIIPSQRTVVTQILPNLSTALQALSGI